MSRIAAVMTSAMLRKALSHRQVDHTSTAFSVGFNDDGVRGVYPSTDDPLQFEEQILSTECK